MTDESPTPAPTGAGDAVLVRKQPFWRRIGGDGLIVSILIHIALFIFFAAWVISSWTDTAKSDVDTFTTGAGGGSAGERAKIHEHKLQPKDAKNLAKNQARITTKNTNSSITLPDLPANSTPSLTTGLTSGGSSKGLGSGSGGGIGSGKGIGVGNGKNFVGLFGAKFGGAGLTGTFYDLKQDPDRKPTEMMGGKPEVCGDPSNAQAVKLFVKQAHAFVDARWSEQKLHGFYQAPEKLSATQFFIPRRQATAAPEAYGCLLYTSPSPRDS